jgi:regulator of replication initiation timing
MFLGVAGTLKSINKQPMNASANSTSTHQQLHAVKQSLKQLRAEQQALQLEIVAARKQKEALLQSIAKLKK